MTSETAIPYADGDLADTLPRRLLASVAPTILWYAPLLDLVP